MSLTVRRVISFVAVATIVVAAGMTYSLLPGASGFFDELRWLLSRDKRVGLNRSLAIIEIAHDENRISRSATYTVLLNDADTRVVDGALSLLEGLLLIGSPPGFTQPHGPSAELHADFLNWLDSTTDEQKLAHIAPIVGIMSPDVSWRVMMARYPEYKYLRIFLLATLSRDKHVRSAGMWFGNSGGHTDWSTMDLRLADLDGAVPTPGAPAPADWAPLDVPSEFVGALTDGFPQVRWAAGRLLAVCRDERGLPAAYDWLQNDPNAPASANQVLDELFGLDWRKPFEK